MPNITSCQVGATQTNGTMAVRIATPAIDEYVMMVVECSLPLIIRVMISVPAQHIAETIGRKAATGKADVPGRRMISTPNSPVAVAIQRRTPTFSDRNRIDSAVTKIGETKAVAEA